MNSEEILQRSLDWLFMILADLSTNVRGVEKWRSAEHVLSVSVVNLALLQRGEV